MLADIPSPPPDFILLRSAHFSRSIEFLMDKVPLCIAYQISPCNTLDYGGKMDYKRAEAFTSPITEASDVLLFLLSSVHAILSYHMQAK